MNASPSTLRQSLRACTFDGTFHAAMLGFGELYIPAFALLLGATPFQVGVLATVPMLVGAGFQLVSPTGGAWLGAKPWVVGSAVLQALTFLPIGLAAASTPAEFRWLLGWVCLYWMLALGINPVWNAWLGRMIPPPIRSRYFGRRNVPIQVTLFVSLVAGGLLIHAGERSSWGAASGFLAAFGLAATSRLASAWCLSRQHDPGAGVAGIFPSTRALLLGWHRQPYRRLILLLVMMSGAVHVSAAYFTPFMLQQLELSYAQFTILNGTIVVARAVASPYWGDIARYYGNRRALQVAVVLLVPLSGLWVVSSNFTYLVVLQLVAGFAWAGFELTTVLNFFDCTDERNRAAVLSLYNLLNGIVIVLATLVGGLILQNLGGDGYRAIFLASSVLRAVTIAFLAKGVGARRAMEHSFSDVFTRVITLRPGQGAGLRPVVLNQRGDAGGGTGDRTGTRESAGT